MPFGDAIIVCKSKTRIGVKTCKKTKPETKRNSVAAAAAMKYLYLAKESKKYLESFARKRNMSAARSAIAPINIGQTDEKTSFPIVAFQSVDNFTQVAGKKTKAVANAVAVRII